MQQELVRLDGEEENVQRTLREIDAKLASVMARHDATRVLRQQQLLDPRKPVDGPHGSRVASADSQLQVHAQPWLGSERFALRQQGARDSGRALVPPAAIAHVSASVGGGVLPQQQQPQQPAFLPYVPAAPQQPWHQPTFQPRPPDQFIAQPHSQPPPPTVARLPAAFQPASFAPAGVGGAWGGGFPAAPSFYNPPVVPGAWRLAPARFAQPASYPHAPLGGVIKAQITSAPPVLGRQPFLQGMAPRPMLPPWQLGAQPQGAHYAPRHAPRDMTMLTTERAQHFGAQQLAALEQMQLQQLAMLQREQLARMGHAVPGGAQLASLAYHAQPQQHGAPRAHQ
ncbi:hypothetical protein KFE25_010033 [Diacronema lutheri]|uniref:Uncharacterized protein n=1 Tax=Diacronema lutheri TaxID=2081491 RepID=A0A8J5XSJ7_DIALT|nr:hypothetical protein KFE25_010033 [Diacronema lutheri]